MNTLTLGSGPDDMTEFPQSDSSDDKSSNSELIPGQVENPHPTYGDPKHPNPNTDESN